MFCENCGSKLVENAAFCTACGHKVKSRSREIEEIGQRVPSKRKQSQGPIPPVMRKQSQTSGVDMAVEQVEGKRPEASESQPIGQTRRPPEPSPRHPSEPYSGQPATNLSRHPSEAYASPSKGKSLGISSTIGYGEYLISLILSGIPIVGFVFLIKWAFIDKTNENKANFAKAMLTMVTIGFIFGIIWIMTVASYMS